LQEEFEGKSGVIFRTDKTKVTVFPSSRKSGKKIRKFANTISLCCGCYEIGYENYNSTLGRATWVYNVNVKNKPKIIHIHPSKIASRTGDLQYLENIVIQKGASLFDADDDGCYLIIV